MTQYDLNYVEKNTNDFKTKTFKNLEEALNFIKNNENNYSYYTLWETTAKIIKEK